MTGSLLSRLIRGTISTGLGKLSTMVLGLVGVMVVTRHLSAKDLGAFVLITVVVSFLVQVSSFGLGISLPRFITGTKDELQRRRLVNTVLCFRLFTIVVVSLIALPFRAQIAGLFGSPLLPGLTIFVPLLFFLQSSMYLLQSALQGFFLFERIGISDFIAGFFNFLFIWVFVLLLQRGVVGLIYAKVISMFVSLGFMYYSIPVKKKIEFHPDVLKETLAFGFPLQINDILFFIFSRIDTVIIGVMLGPAGVAYYEVARKIPEYLGQIYEAFRCVYFPLISELFMGSERKRAAQLLNNSTRLVSFVTAAGALMAWLFGKDLFVLLFSEQYLASVPAFIWLMVALVVALVGSTLGMSVVAVGDSDKPAIVNVVHTVVSVVGNLIFIPALGIVGAALASLAGIVATNPLDVLFLRRRDVDVRVREYLKPILIFGAHAAIIFLLQPITFLPKVLVVISFLLTSVVLSVITAEDLAALLAEARSISLKSMTILRSGSNRS